MLESSEVEGGGSAAAVGSTYASAVKSLEEEGGEGATLEEDSTLGHLELALSLRNVAPIGAIMCTSLNARNSSKPKCNKIR